MNRPHTPARLAPARGILNGLAFAAIVYALAALLWVAL